MPLIAWLLACTSAPTDALAWRESWELLAVTDAGGFVDATLTVANTGLLRGQGHVRVNRSASGQPPLLLAVDAPAEQVSISDGHEAVHIAASALTVDASGRRTLQTRSEDGGATLLISPRPVSPVAASTWTDGPRQWRVEVSVPLADVVGGVTAGPLGGELRATGVVLHRGGDAVPASPRRTALVLGPDLSIGVDEQGKGRLAWAWVGEAALDTSDARIEVVGPRRWRVDLRPAADVVVELRRPASSSTRSPLDHLLAPERWLAAGAGLPVERAVRRTRADLTMAGVSRQAMGLTVELR